MMIIQRERTLVAEGSLHNRVRRANAANFGEANHEVRDPHR
jgi:hypothetical protein